jgi:hypothetical protein
MPFEQLRRHLALLGALLAASIACAQTPGDSSPSAEELAQALGKLATGVEASTRIRGPVAGNVGQFVIRRTDGREVGAYVRQHRFPVDQTPPIWINIVDDLGQVVLRVRNQRLEIDKIPSDWIASDYLRERKPTPATISFIALNPRRHVRTLPGGDVIVAATDLISTGISPNAMARTRFWVDQAAKQTRAFSTMVYGVRDAAEAHELLDALDRLPQ